MFAGVNACVSHKDTYQMTAEDNLDACLCITKGTLLY